MIESKMGWLSTEKILCEQDISVWLYPVWLYLQSMCMIIYSCSMFQMTDKLIKSFKHDLCFQDQTHSHMFSFSYDFSISWNLI